MSDNKLLAIMMIATVVMIVVIEIVSNVGKDKVLEAKKEHLRRHQSTLNADCEFCDAIRRYLKK